MTAPLSTADLLEGLAVKKRYKYVFFWGDTPRRDGVIDNSCLSQWFSAPFTVDGIRSRRRRSAGRCVARPTERSGG